MVQQQYPSRPQTYSQDIRIQMSEPVHTEVHLPQQMQFDPQEYQPKIKKNNHFIAGSFMDNQKVIPQPSTNEDRMHQQSAKDNLINRNIAEAYPDQMYHRSNVGLQTVGENVINQNIANISALQTDHRNRREARGQLNSENPTDHTSVHASRMQQEHNKTIQRGQTTTANACTSEFIFQEGNRNNQSQEVLRSDYQVAAETLEENNRNATSLKVVYSEERANGVLNRRQDADLGKAINEINQFPPRNIHHEYRSANNNVSEDGQFFVPQMQEQQLSLKRSKAIQVDHVEQQCVIRRNMFKGKNPLCIEETERPVFVNNYYTGDNPQHMFHEAT